MEELEKTVAEQAKALEEKDVIIASLVKENSEFKAKLAVYENFRSYKTRSSH